MGVYTSNRTNLSNIDFAADESYVGEIGAYTAMIENAQNDLALFNGIIANDFTETALLLKETAGEDVSESLTALQEGAIQDIANKVIAFIKKVAAKVKGLILSFVTKVGAFLTRSNKELLKKYNDKVTGRDLSKLKFKWNAPTSKANLGTSLSVDAATAAVQTSLSKYTGNITQADEKRINADSEELDEFEDYKDKILQSASGISSTDFKTFKKDSFEEHFEDEEKIEGLNSTILTEIKKTLEGCDKKLSTLKASVSKVDAVFNKAIKAVEKARTAVIGTKSTTSQDITSTKIDDNNSLNHGTTEGSITTASKALTNIQKAVSASQAVYSLIISTDIAEYKFHIAQCRRVFIQAASYSTRKSVGENTIFVEAVGDAVDYEFNSDLEELGL